MQKSAICSLLVTLLFLTGLSLYYQIDQSAYLMGSAGVTVDLFVMSKCPDGVFAQSTFHAIQQHPNLRVPSSVNLAFITDAEGGCMHGPSECEGNKIELAAQQHLGGTKEHGILSFTEAYDREYKSIGAPDQYLTETFKLANITTSKQEAILKTYEKEGNALLMTSSAYAKEKKARYSATIMIQGGSEVLAIRDSNQWKGLVEGLGEGAVEDWVTYFNDLQQDVIHENM